MMRHLFACLSSIFLLFVAKRATDAGFFFASVARYGLTSFLLLVVRMRSLRSLVLTSQSRAVIRPTPPPSSLNDSPPPEGGLSLWHVAVLATGGELFDI